MSRYFRAKYQFGYFWHALIFLFLKLQKKSIYIIDSSIDSKIEQTEGKIDKMKIPLKRIHKIKYFIKCYRFTQLSNFAIDNFISETRSPNNQSFTIIIMTSITPFTWWCIIRTCMQSWHSQWTNDARKKFIYIQWM